MNTEAKRTLDSLVAELADPDSDVLDRVGSTYAFEIDTDSGPLHLLFRLDNGNPDWPSIVAFYLDGQLANEMPPDFAEMVVRELLEQAPWLIFDE
jgi:hypothetical protein